jgi:O-antigen ligase
MKLHPTFLTLFICLSLFVISDYIRREKKYYGLHLISLFFVLFSLQLASRAGLAALACTLFLIGFSYVQQKGKLILIGFAILVVVGLTASILTIPSLKQRLVDEVVAAMDISKEQKNSVSYHFKNWYCAVETWLSGHVIFGYGTGDEVDTITQCYHEKRWLGNGHDAHNEFLSSLVKHGIVGLIVLSASFFYPFYLALKYRDLRYVCFLTIVLISFMSESMLRGQTGLVFYTMFNALFLKVLLEENDILGRRREPTLESSTVV